MPASKKKRITPANAPSTSQPSSPLLPEQQAFHQHLRDLAQSAVRTVLELVMREELDATIILTALGVDLQGNKEVLALQAYAEESSRGI
jgi:hypothetical protein